MSSGHVLDDREEYLKNKYFEGHIFSNFSAFYFAISVCFYFTLFLVVLNVYLCWCSEHRQYWIDRYTGNRWLVSLWTATPHHQPPLDYTELEAVVVNNPPVIINTVHPDEYLELQQTKRESDI